MNYLSIHLTSDDKQILAAAVGAILGAFGAYMVGLLVEKRVRRREGKREDLAKLREYAQSITKAEVCCQEVLVVLYDAEHLLGQCAGMIKDGVWIVTLPRQVSINDVSALDFRNAQLIAEWTTLRFRIDKLNHLIQEFNDHYTAITREYEQMALHGKSGVAQVIRDNDEVLKGFALKVREITRNVIGTVKHVYALVSAHAELNSHKEVRIKSTAQLNEFKVYEEHYKKIRARLDKRFNYEAFYGAAAKAEAPAVPPAPPPISPEPDKTTAPTAATS